MVMTLLPHYETSDVRIEKIVVGPFENNVFVLRSKSTGDAVIIDAANEHELLLEVSRATGRAARAHHARPLRSHPGGHADARRGDRRGHRGRGRQDAAELRLRDPRRRRDRGRRPAPADDSHARSHAGLHVLPARRVTRSSSAATRSFPAARATRRSRTPTSTRSSSRSTAGCSRCPPTRSCSPGHGLDTTIASESPHLDEWIARGW